MKYICLGYIEPGKFEGMTGDQRHAVLDECFEHNDHLRANSHLVGELALQPPETALTLYWKKPASTAEDVLNGENFPAATISRALPTAIYGNKSSRRAPKSCNWCAGRNIRRKRGPRGTEASLSLG